MNYHHSQVRVSCTSIRIIMNELPPLAVITRVFRFCVYYLHFITEKSAESQLYLDKIENLNVTHPDWPFAVVRLGKAYLLLEDIHGALEQFEKTLRLLSPLQDEKFARYVEGLRAYVKVTKSPFVNTITRH